MKDTIALWRPILVLASAGGLLLIGAFVIRSAFREGRRLAILEAGVILGTLVWLITEALSAFKAITVAGLAVSWGIAGCVAIIGLALAITNPTRREHVSKELEEFRRTVQSVSGGQFAVLAFITLCVLLLGIIAFTGAPNTPDSMTYHLSRVMHWQQDRSLDFYPTAIQRQLAFSPGAEMIVLNLQILAGSDRLANFVQFGAMLGCLIGASLLAMKLGGGRRAQILAALATITIPMGILQSTSTQNDYVVALWCVCFTVFTFVQMEQGPSNRLAVFSGMALGLAILTKITAVLYVPFIGLWFARHLARRRRLAAVGAVLTILSIATIMFVPYAIRNYGLYRNPLGISPSPELEKYTNETYGASVVVSNILRNMGLELTLPSLGMNQALQTTIQKAHDLMRININDPLTTWDREKFKIGFTTDENGASNPLQMILVALSALLLMWRREGKATTYMLCLAGGAFLFCLLLKWQPFHNRLHLPFFVLSLPLFAVVGEKYLRGGMLYVAILILGAIALPYVFDNPSRPALGHDSVFVRPRLEQYFYYPLGPNEFASHEAAAKLVSEAKCDRIGLVIDRQAPEYFVWVTAQAYVPQVRIEHIEVKNTSGILGTDFSPCAIIVRPPTGKTDMIYGGGHYISELQTETLRLYLISGSTP